MKRRIRHIALIFTLLLLGGMANEAWAAVQITYHILTLPCKHTATVPDANGWVGNTRVELDGYRQEAIKVIVTGNTAELPAYLKSPLAKNFTYYQADFVAKKSNTAENVYENNNDTRAFFYSAPIAPYTKVTKSGESITEVASNETEWETHEGGTQKTATSLSDYNTQKSELADGTYYFKMKCLKERDPITINCDIYVTYEYNPANTIAKLDGSKTYNIKVGDQGFLALNRGRNNRPALIPAAKIADHPEYLTSDEFVTIAHDDKQQIIPGTNNVQGYWKDDPYNTRADIAYQFHFLFKYYGLDPYNITIASTYNTDKYYIEVYGKTDIVKKWYKGSILFAQNTATAFFASDDNKQYTQKSYNDPTTPVTFTTKYGYHKALTTVWNSFALLYACDKNGVVNENNLVLMGSRTVKTDKSGNLDFTQDKQYYLSRESASSNNNLKFISLAKEAAPVLDKNMYEIKTVNFKVTTPFYDDVGTTEEKAAHTLTASAQFSEYTLGIKDIDYEDIPASLKRKYCNFNGKFYKDAARTQEITSYSELTEEPYDIYLGYTVSGMPFTAITPAASYSDATWNTATWYELTDEGSIQTTGKKIKYDVDGDANKYFKNNGAADVFEKTSEFAFIGDPYELQVISRSQTSGATPSYVGATGTPTTETAFTASTSATAGYLWEIPSDETNGSFLLRLYKGTGHWYWNANHISEDVTYETSTPLNITNGNAQTITFNISGLEYVNGHYIMVTKGGGYPGQVASTTPTLDSGKGAVRSDGTATVTVTLNANTSSDKSFTITIQEYNGSTNATIGTATVVTITQAAADYAGNAVEYNTSSSTRIKVLELPKRDFTYNIVDKSGRIAVKATASQTIYSPLSLASIPSIIVSPFLYGETVTFYSTFNNGSGAGTGTSRKHLNNEITALTAGNAASSTNVYVKYTTSALDAKPIKLSEDLEFNVKLNGQYLYWEKVDGVNVIRTKATLTQAEEQSEAFLWKLRQRDPYAMIIDNLGARAELWGEDHKNDKEHVDVYNDAGESVQDDGTTPATLDPETRPLRQVGGWVKLSGDLPTTDDGTSLAFDKDRADAQLFIAKSSTANGVYEVMIATGSDVEASTTYYNIGRPSNNTVKIYKNTTYKHGDAELKFELDQNVNYTYYLIDKANHKLVTATSKNPELVLPADYQSPLVGTYHYYDKDNITESGDVYTVNSPATALTDIYSLDATYTKDKDASYSSSWAGELTAENETELDAKAKKLEATGTYYYKVGDEYWRVIVSKAFYTEIYVTYEKNNLVTFNDDESPYMLRFLDPDIPKYHLEDGNDKLTTETIQPIFPYCNGDGSLNIYGSAMNEEQMNGGASTRSRWVWFFNSENDDPYHVKIHSKNTISYNSVSHPTYLQTYAVHFNQDASTNTKHVVTCGILPGIASVEPTEYMILGREGQYKLLTTYPIEETVVDGLADKDNRQYVKTFEQYWKTYDMIKKCVLKSVIDAAGDTYKDAFSNDESTWVMPDELKDDLQDKLDYLGIGSGNWHSYEVIANGKRWNGYNDKGTGTGKVVEKLEHWFQTFNMGDGTFNIESAVIPPVLVLLDRHGWEIMRKPLPSPYSSSEGLDALRAYDSPMVKEYKFYSQATKGTGCHKYVLRMQNGAERDQIKVNGVHYTSTSLADLPPETATGVKSNGAFNDQFVTYTVKEEYENSYQYHLELHEEDSTYAESGTAAKFLILQHGRFARDNEAADKPNYLSKPIRQGSDIAGDNGEVYDMILTPSRTYADPDGDHKVDDINLWYVQPNLKIDEEMGIKWSTTKGASLEPHTEYETKKEYAEKTGFDPYNIQLLNVAKNKYLTTHISTTSLRSGSLVGDYTSGNKTVTLADAFDDYDPSTSKGSEGYDHTNIQMSNQTFMAVQDANGNMQLMPRFDHTQRVNVDINAPYYTTLEDPVNHSVASVDNWRSMGPQTTFFVRPQIFEYLIIDNEGNESLRYKRAGDYTPNITEHFKSPLATDFKYYFGYAACSTTASSKASYDAAATSTYFQKTADDETKMATAAKALTVLDDYYFKIGESAPYTYKKVTVTKGYVAGPPATDATYTTTNCTEAEWTNAVAHQQSSTDEADFISDSKALATEGTHYFQIGPTTLYRMVTVSNSGKTKEAEECSESDWTSHTGATVADMAAYKTALASLSDGTYYYKITAYYSYKKVIVTSSNGDFGSKVASKADISSKEITGTFAEAGLNDMTNQVYVRYSYDASSDVDEILQGKWFTIKLDNKDVQAVGTIDRTNGTGVNLFSGEKPGTIDGTTDERRKWQWKFLAAPVDPESDYYGTLDPYAVRIFNRDKNYTTDMSLNPNPMGTGIKVNGTDRFALLSSSGGYAFAVAGENDTYTYSFLNGENMTAPDAETPVAATTATEAGFTIKTGTISDGSIVVVNDDVTYNYTYNVITNDASGNTLAVSATQDKAGASEHNFAPYLPFDIQSKLLDIDNDYEYYGSATESEGAYTVNDATKLITLYGLYNDEVYVRYKAYDMDKTKYEVPNKKALVDGKVAKHSESKDVALNINAGLPYDIIWENDNMMRSNADSNFDADGIYIKGKAGQDLQSDTENNGYVWKFEGEDPYALKIYNNKQAKYIHAASADNDAACTLTSEATPFMLLNRANYEYGVLEMTGHKGSKLTMTDDNGSTLGVAKITTGNPKYFIIFGLSTHRLIYHLAIAKIGDTVEIPYSDSNYPRDSHYTVGSNKLVIDGTTQRDLSETYQLGETIFGKTYSVNAGEVSIGDVLKVPTEFERPNCLYYYYVDNIQTAGETSTFQKNATDENNMNTQVASFGTVGYYYFKIGNDPYTYKRVQVTSVSPVVSTTVDCTADDWSNCWQDNTALNSSYKGMEVTKLMSDASLIGGLVQINIGYAFQTGLETNAGEGFVTSTDQNLWYTYETKHDDGTPYLAQYTNAWGLQAKAGRDTRYTNDYLWSPVGDVYGFKMYNRYMIKNSGGVNNVMTMPSISEGTNLKLALPGSDGIPEGNEVFELLGSNTPGYFRIHPVINKDGTQYYVWKDPTDNYAKISTNYSEWTFNLPAELLKPYIDRIGYVGGLEETVYTANKAIMDKVKNGTATYPEMLEVQRIVYNDANIVRYSPGYYRLHSQPGVSGISPVRYASGYLHKTELTGDGGVHTTGPIPMHFYSKAGVTTTFGTSGLKSGYTVTNATQGDIPVPATEYDPSSIFYFPDNDEKAGNPRSTMRTQGLYVVANANGDAANGTTTNRLQKAVMSDNSANAITFSLMDIGGAVLLIHNGAEPRERIYLNFDQSNTFQKTATDVSDMNANAAQLTSIGTYYFKIGSSTYKRVTITTAKNGETPAVCEPASGGAESNQTEWERAADIYDLKYYHDTPTDDAKWCMVAADTLGLMVTTNNGGDDYYYGTFYAPYDVQLPDNAKYNAYIGTSWSNTNVRTAKVTKDGYTDGKFIPAGTPVIIRTTDNSGYVKLTFPTTTPSSPLSSCVFSGSYLEQLLDDGGGNEVYTLGLPFTSNVTKDVDYEHNGKIDAPVPEQAKTGVGFYINANPNKEHDALQSLWLRNNRYVLHNKIYYREVSSGSSAPAMTRGVEFVPVIFDDEEPGEEELQPDGSVQVVGDGCIYDLLGRKVATKEQVEDGTWRERLAPGIYILNGKKFKK